MTWSADDVDDDEPDNGELSTRVLPSCHDGRGETGAMSSAAHDISVRPIHLGLGATSGLEPEFTGAMEWYGAVHHRRRQAPAALSNIRAAALP